MLVFYRSPFRLTYGSFICREPVFKIQAATEIILSSKHFVHLQVFAGIR
jgi:hypothetical protein